MKTEPQILLTNDDGIKSPGLWAAAEALDELGYVTVIAPREQASGTGRSFPSTYDGQVHAERLQVNGKEWTVHALGGTPAMAVLYGIFNLIPGNPDLIVSGINYGLNVGSGVTISGTVGAALEGAAAGIPSLAVSLETEKEYHASYSLEIDFSAAGFFTKYFAQRLLTRTLPPDVGVLKVEVPADATKETPWQTTRLSTLRFYEPTPPEENSGRSVKGLGYKIAPDFDQSPLDTDSYAVVNQRIVAVTPLSLDLTSRVDLGELKKLLGEE
ncbi:MAG TPA: 5'/3'-nucleotidase SurE [Chloroflexi bacterium]|nr:5'/3'-nucleotidase SurE [Chloroflexota bacterium]